jgi:hypothetical protein
MHPTMSVLKCALLKDPWRNAALLWRLSDDVNIIRLGEAKAGGLSNPPAMSAGFRSAAADLNLNRVKLERIFEGNDA